MLKIQLVEQPEGMAVEYSSQNIPFAFGILPPAPRQGHHRPGLQITELIASRTVHLEYVLPSGKVFNGTIDACEKPPIDDKQVIDAVENALCLEMGNMGYSPGV